MISLFVSVSRSCSETVAWLQQRLWEDGLEVTQVVDASRARLAMEGYSCPHHGTEACDCKTIVLVVHGRSRFPASLILHGSNGHTWVSLAERAEGNADPSTVAIIQRALTIDDRAAARSSVFATIRPRLGHWTESWTRVRGE